MKQNFSFLLLAGVAAVSLALSVAVYGKTNGGTTGALVGVYTFGLVIMSGAFTIFPGGTKVKNEWGDKKRVGRVNNLSAAQVIIFLSWFIGVGGIVVYFVEFHKGL